MTTPDKFLKEIRLAANKDLRTMRRKMLSDAIEDGSLYAINQHCFHRAIERDVAFDFQKLLLYGFSVRKLTAEDSEAKMHLVYLWSARIRRWWGLK